MLTFTQDQIIKLAPDDASAKAGQALAVNTKWVVRAVHEKALWGDCQGSGKTPYKTMVDLTSIAFKCSCPSRKFPCKHGLGLLLLYAHNPSVFSQENELPPAVAEWLDKREAHAEAKPAEPESKSAEEKPADEAGKLKRVEARQRKVKNGMEELRSWLKDVVRAGIAHVPQDPYKFNRNITARMIDSQAGGIAAQLRKINKINFYKEGWQKDLTRQLAKIYLISEAYNLGEQLGAEWQQELAGIVGWNTPKEEVLNSHATRDHWQVLSKTMEDEGTLTTERIWLYSKHNKGFALILNFYVGNQLPQQMLLEGSTIDAELVFYPAIMPQRALIKNQVSVDMDFKPSPGLAGIAHLHKTVAHYLALNPFMEMIPYMLSGIRLVFEGQSWYLKDADHQALPIANPEEECWKILSISKAMPFTCFGVYENERFEIHALWTDKIFNFIK